MKKTILLLLCLILSGCAHVVSEQSMKLVDRSITYEQLRENPEAFRGKYVLLGGIIASVRNTKEEAYLEVVQLPLDSSEVPEDMHNTGGRFIATTKKFLDPLIFKQGKRVTLVGEVKGKMVKTLDQVEYLYPVVAIREMHLWRPEEYERYGPYPSAMYPYYWYDPWWPYWYYRPGPFGPW